MHSRSLEMCVVIEIASQKILFVETIFFAKL